MAYEEEWEELKERIFDFYGSRFLILQDMDIPPKRCWLFTEYKYWEVTMEKGIIVIDEIPQSCRTCRLRKADGYCIIAQKNVFYYGLNYNKPNWCPIKKVSSNENNPAARVVLECKGSILQTVDEEYVTHSKQRMSGNNLENISDEELMHRCMALSMQLQEEYLTKPQNFEHQKILNTELVGIKDEILGRMQKQ